MNDGVNNNYRLCQANLEMSYSYQSRNVLFSGFRVYGFTSFIFMTTKLEIPPPEKEKGTWFTICLLLKEFFV